MKVEAFFYGMIKGKIVLLKTDSVTNIISDSSFQFLRKLTPQDNNVWWLPTEQIVAISKIIEIDDNDGRTWVQNETFLVPISDYLKLTNPQSIFQKFFEIPVNDLPLSFEPLQIEVNQ